MNRVDSQTIEIENVMMVAVPGYRTTTGMIPKRMMEIAPGDKTPLNGMIQKSLIIVVTTIRKTDRNATATIMRVTVILLTIRKLQRQTATPQNVLNDLNETLRIKESLMTNAIRANGNAANGNDNGERDF